MKADSVSIVIPAFNEEKTIKGVVKDIILIFKKLEVDYEIVLVNDGSTDDTGKIIDELARIKRIRAVHHKRNKGFTGAMKTAFASACKNLIFLAPADGQFDFKELPQFIKAIKGYDAVIAYRVENEEGLIRKINSWGFRFLSRVFFDIKLREFSTVSLWRKKIFEDVTIESDNRSGLFLTEFIYKALKNNSKFTSVPIHWYERKGGSAKGAGLKVILKTFIEIGRLWVKIRVLGK